MKLIRLNGHDVPDPVQYVVNLLNVDGSEEQMEDGQTYRERIASQKPSISVGWKNLLEDDVTEILSQIKQTGVEVDYWFGGWQKALLSSDEPQLTLKTDSDALRWDLTFKLE